MPTINSWNSNIPVEISKGGTNATAMATATGIVKYDGTSLVTSAAAKIDASDRYTNTSQPAFLAVQNDLVSNVTGDGTVYTLTMDTEIFDQGNNFDGTSTFTAPVTGRYMLFLNSNTSDYSASHTIGDSRIVTSNRTYYDMFFNYGSVTLTANELITQMAVFADMDAGDTATAATRVANGTKIVNMNTQYFSGYLVC